MRTSSPRGLALLLLATATCSVACSGSIGDDGTPPRPGDPPSAGGGAPGGRPPPPPVVPPPTTTMTTPPPVGVSAGGPMPMRRLGRLEHANTLRALFGAEIPVGAVPDDPVGESTYEWPTNIGGVELDAFQQAAHAVARAVAPRIKDLAPCPAGSADRACAGELVRVFGQRVFRRPLLDAESLRLLALYDALRAAPVSYDHAAAMSELVAAMLQAPQFLYRWELGPARPTKSGTLVRLNGWEIASRLSYFLWSSMPDAELFAAAANGTLDTAAGVEAQARRLLKDTARAKHLVAGLFGTWFALSTKLPSLVKEKSVIADFGDPLRNAMKQELELFLARALLTDGRWPTVLTSRESFVNAPLAKLYGLTGVTGDAFVARTLPPERAGLFTQAAFLAIEALPQESSPVRRGKTVVERLLCRHIAPPPPNVDADPPPIPDGIQTREAYTRHQSDPTCSGCHAQMDPIGFGFESFDAVGRFRATEAGRPVDTRGTLPFLDGRDTPFRDAAEMMKMIADSRDGRECVATQFMRYALGRRLFDGDAAAVKAVVDRFVRSDLDLRELVVSIAASDAFRLRSPATGEVTE